MRVLKNLLAIGLLAVTVGQAVANDVLWEEKASGSRLVARDTTILSCIAVNNSFAKGVERLCVRGGMMDGVPVEKFAEQNGYTKIDRVGLLREGGQWMWVIVVIKQ